MLELDIVKMCLVKAKKTMLNIGAAGTEIIHQGESFGSLLHDTEIKADKEIGEAIFNSLQTLPESGRISIEGLVGDCCPEGHGSPLWICVDPLDGSLNYRQKGQTLGLPYTTCVTVLSKRWNATFADIIACGVIDLRSGDIWFAWKDSQGYHATINDCPAKTDQRKKLDLGSMIIFGEMYYPENRALLQKMFADEKGWLRNPGSAAYEMAMVASGNVVAFICDRQKQHELGAGYLLVKAAGGCVTDFDGNEINNLNYGFNIQTPVILAANQDISKQLVSKAISARTL